MHGIMNELGLMFASILLITLHGKPQQALNTQLRVLSPNTKTKANVRYTRYVFTIAISLLHKSITAKFSESKVLFILVDNGEVFNPVNSSK